MGKLIKNHWARLVVMVAAACMFKSFQITRRYTDIRTDQIAAALEGFFWPKFFFDFLTTNFDGAVKPIPILQIINLFCGIITLAYEWPLNFLSGTKIHTSLLVRLMWLPLASLNCVLIYQATDPALYYLVGTIAYFWAYSEGEVICAAPWSLPKRIEKPMNAGDKV